VPESVPLRRIANDPAGRPVVGFVGGLCGSACLDFLGSGDALVKRIIIVGILLLAFRASDALAQAPCLGSTSTFVTQGQMNSLLNNRWACVGSFPTASWNEQHVSGHVLDYKLGPTGGANGADPSDTLSHPTGTYATSAVGATPQTQGIVTYTYGSNSYAYYIYLFTGGGTIPWASANTYAFCGIGSAPNLTVTISNAHC
jgi:hypothetical protein